MKIVPPKSFFLVIPTRERKDFLLNLLNDFTVFAEYISNCVVVDQSDEFLGNGFDYSAYNFKITLLKGDKSKGVNHSRNLALSEYSNEDWLFFLDDDLRIPAVAFNQIIEVLRPNIIDVLIPGIQFDGIETKEFQYHTVLDTIAKPRNFSKGRFRLQVCSGLNVVKRDVFKEAGFYFDENFTIWGDDWDYGMRLLQAGANIYFQPKILVEHLGAPNGGQREKARTLNIDLEKKKLYFYFLRKHFSKNVVKQQYYLGLIEGMKILICSGRIKQLRTTINAYKFKI
ncbi:MAG: hypothetical protein RLZZ546_370 [Bacteroidota bacterium]|jgi:GT2 family glycosyltransferase